MRLLAVIATLIVLISTSWRLQRDDEIPFTIPDWVVDEVRRRTGTDNVR